MQVGFRLLLSSVRHLAASLDIWLLNAAVLKAEQRQLGAAVNATAKWPTGARTHQKTAKLVGKHHQLLTTFCPIEDMTAPG
jgi:hypothetical protein